MCRFSIIMPTFNDADFLPLTLESVIAAMGDDDELIIVDDFSTDGTEEVVARFLRENVIYYRMRKNSGGPSKPRNAGIKLARGQFVAFFDSDDLMAAGKLELALNAFNEFPDAGLVFNNFSSIAENGDVLIDDFLGRYSFIQKLREESDGDSMFPVRFPDSTKELAKANFIGTSGVVIRREVFDFIGLFDEELLNGDDYDMWLRISRRFPLVFLDRNLHSYRINTSGISSLGVLKTSPAKIRVLKKTLENPIDKGFKKDICRWIYINYFAMGMAMYRNANMAEARSNFLLALKYRFTLRSCSFFLLTFFGARSSYILRSIKNTLKGSKKSTFGE